MVNNNIYEAEMLRHIGDTKLSSSFRVIMINALHDHYSELRERLASNATRLRRDANVIARQYQQNFGCACDEGLCDCALAMYGSKDENDFCADLHHIANMLNRTANRYESKLRRLERLAKAIHAPALRMAA